MKTVAVYAGSFDPITNGHLDILYKACDVFDVVYCAVGNNPAKKHLFNLEQRMDMILNSCANPKVQVVSFSGSLVQFCRDKDCTHIIRGLRSVTDYEYEIQLAAANKEFRSDTNTVFFIPDAEHLHISSSMVKEFFCADEDVSKFISPYVLNMLKGIRATNELMGKA